MHTTWKPVETIMTPVAASIRRHCQPTVLKNVPTWPNKLNLLVPYSTNSELERLASWEEGCWARECANLWKLFLRIIWSREEYEKFLFSFFPNIFIKNSIWIIFILLLIIYFDYFILLYVKLENYLKRIFFVVKLNCIIFIGSEFQLFRFVTLNILNISKKMLELARSIF